MASLTLCMVYNTCLCITVLLIDQRVNLILFSTDVTGDLSLVHNEIGFEWIHKLLTKHNGIFCIESPLTSELLCCNCYKEDTSHCCLNPNT